MANPQVAVTNGIAPPPVRTSRLPQALRFPLLIIISLSLSVFSYSAAYEMLGYKFGSVSRTINETWGPAVFLSARVVELYIGWYMCYDDIDIINLSLLTQAPTLFLLHSFYLVPPSAIFARFAVDTISVVLPTKLLRSRSVIHNRNAPIVAVPNRNIIHSTREVMTTAALGATVYSVVCSLALNLGFTSFMVSHFDLPSLEAAHTATVQSLVLYMLPIGFAVQSFLFTQSLGAQTNLGDAVRSTFNPATATLGQTVKHNVWGWSKRTKVLIKQTVILMVLTGSVTVRMSWTNEGTDIIGASAYAGIWVLAGLVSGVMFGWVGNLGDAA